MIKNTTLAALAAMILGSAGALLDGPSDYEVEVAVAQTVIDATEQAKTDSKFWRELARCRQQAGQLAELVEVGGTHVCRKAEPKEDRPPIRYATLGMLWK